MNLKQLVIATIDHVESLDQQIVDLTGQHAEESSDSNRIGTGKYYLAHGSVWVGGSYAVRPSGYSRPGELELDSPGECRRCLSDLLEITSMLVGIIAESSAVAARTEERCRTMVAAAV